MFKQQVICSLRQRLSDEDQKHKDVITEIHGIGSLFRFVSNADDWSGILDELELLQSQYVANIRKKGKYTLYLYHLCDWILSIAEREIAEQMDEVQEHVAEYIKQKGKFFLSLSHV